MRNKLVFYLFTIGSFTYFIASQSFAYAQGVDSVEFVSVVPPVVISESLYDIDNDGKTEKIEILLEKGRRYDDKELWCGNGEKWEGYFSIRIRKEETVLFQQSLNSLMLQSRENFDSLFFRTPEFPLVFRDYNWDGQIDFNLGQYAGCNGSSYNLFTIHGDGSVTLLPAEGREYGFFLSNPHDNPNSTDAIHAEYGGVIEFSYYDQTRRNIKARYEWNGERFILLKEELE